MSAMNFKKAWLLLALLLALASLSIPAMSSAHVWTDDGVALALGDEATDSYEGIVTITVPKTMLLPHSTVNCPVTLQIRAEGPSAGQILAFNGTTALCEGTGLYAGCQVVADETNLSSGWVTGVELTPIPIKKSGGGSGKVTLRYVFNACAAAALHLEFVSITVTPTLNGAKRITLLSLSGTATSGVTISGGLTPEEGSTTLGLQ